VVKAESASIGGELAAARAMASQDRKAAADALRRAKQKGATAEELQEYIPLVDESLFEELGVDRPRRRH
jgi:hypothetical protein